MKDQSSAALHSLSQASTVYAHLAMQHLQNLTHLWVTENGHMIERMQGQLQAVAHAKTPAEVLQLTSEHMVISANAKLALALKTFTLGYEEQAELMAAMQKQLAQASSAWPSVLDPMLNGTVAGASLYTHTNGHAQAQAHQEAKSGRKSAAV